MRHLALITILLVLSGCSQERLMEKKRLKAEALVKEAIETFPGIIQPVITTDTITLISPPVVIKEQIGYSKLSVDSIFVACSEVVKAKNDSIRALLARKIVSRACNIDTAKFSKGSVDVMVWAQNGVLDVLVMKHAEQLDTAVTTSTRVIQSNPCPPVQRVKSWSWVLLIVGIVVGFVLAMFIRGTNRYE